MPVVMASELDRSAFRKRLWLRLITAPATLLPLIGGSTLLILSWALQFKSGLPAFAGILGVLGGIGTFVTRLLTGTDRLGEKVVAEMKAETEGARERELDRLERELAGDQDPRTEQALHDLRVLHASFEKGEMWSSDLNVQSGFDIVSGVNQLFAACVNTLQRTLELWHTAHGVATPEAKRPILERRERLVEEVTTSMRHLSNILAEVQTVSVSSDSTSKLGRIRDELDASLAVAKRVEERMASWEKIEYDLDDISS